MKTKILILFLCAMLFALCAMPFTAIAANKFWWGSCLTGGGDCLDGIDGDELTVGDSGAVNRDAGSTEPEIYFFRVYASSASESSPFVITPDTDPGTKRWHLVNLYGKGLSIPKVSGSAGDVGLYEADSTDLDTAGLRGPLTLDANTSYRGRLPSARATSGNMVQAWTNAGETGTGTPADPFIQAMSFVDLDGYSLTGHDHSGVYQPADATLAALAGLTIADVSIIEGTGADAFNVVTSGGGNRLLGSNAGNTALEFKDTLNIDTLDMASATSSTPWPVGTATWPTTEGRAKWDSTNDVLYGGSGSASMKFVPIDDTATNGNTNRTWSADKIYDELALKQAADADLTTYAGITPSANAQTLLGETFAQMQASLSVDDLITLSGVAEGSAHLGTFTGTTIADSVTIKAALQALETSVETKAPLTSPTFVTSVGLPATLASAAAVTWTLMDNQASGLSFGATGAADILKIGTLDTGPIVSVGGRLSATTYGSDGSITDAELLYINTLSSNAQTQISGKQASDATLTALAGLTIADVSIIEGTGVDAFNVVTSGGGNRLLGSNAGNTALEFKDTLNIDTLDMASATSSTPWPVGTSTWPTTEGRAKWDSSNNVLYVGDGAASKLFDPRVMTTAGDMIYGGTSGLPTRLAIGADTYVLTVSASTHLPVWAAAGAGGATAWDDIADPDAAGSIAFAGYQQTITSTLNSAGAVLTLTNTTADLTADVSFIDFKYTDDGDANGYFMRGYDNAGGDLKWYIGADGAFVGKSFTATKVTGTPGSDLLFSDYLTEEYGVGRKGPHATSARGANLYLQYSNSDPAANQFELFPAPTTGTSTAVWQTYGLPTSNDGLALGSASVMWSDLFLAAGGVINWDNGNATLTHSTGLITSNVPLSVGTSNAITAGTLELGAATDTTLARSAGGIMTVENKQVATVQTATIDGSAHVHLTAEQMQNPNCIVTNLGQAGADVDIGLPTASVGLSCMFTVATAQAFHWGALAAAGDAFYIVAANGTISTKGTDADAVVMTAAQLGQSFACWTQATGAGPVYDWFCKAIAIGTSTFVAHAAF